MKNPKELQEEFEEKYKKVYSLSKCDDPKEGYLYEDVESAWQYYKQDYYKNEKAFSMLALYGVPRKRAGSIANGIDVLATRMQREIQSLEYDIQMLKRGLDD